MYRITSQKHFLLTLKIEIKVCIATLLSSAVTTVANYVFLRTPYTVLSYLLGKRFGRNKTKVSKELFGRKKVAKNQTKKEVLSVHSHLITRIQDPS